MPRDLGLQTWPIGRYFSIKEPGYVDPHQNYICGAAIQHENPDWEGDPDGPIKLDGGTPRFHLEKAVEVAQRGERAWLRRTIGGEWFEIINRSILIDGCRVSVSCEYDGYRSTPHSPYDLPKDDDAPQD